MRKTTMKTVAGVVMLGASVVACSDDLGPFGDAGVDGAGITRVRDVGEPGGVGEVDARDSTIDALGAGVRELIEELGRVQDENRGLRNKIKSLRRSLRMVKGQLEECEGKLGLEGGCDEGDEGDDEGDDEHRHGRRHKD